MNKSDCLPCARVNTGLIGNLFRFKRFDAFISHAAPDLSSAKSLALAAKTQGLHFSYDERSVSDDDRFDGRTREAIRDSSVLVLLLTKTAIARPHVAFEIAHALRLRIPVVPVFLEYIDPRSFTAPFDRVAHSDGQECPDGVTVGCCQKIGLMVRALKRRRLCQQIAVWAVLFAAAGGLILLSGARAN